jgi:GLPGLI family protein
MRTLSHTFSLLLILCLSNTLHAQLVLQGKIEYERKVNLRRQFDNDDYGERMRNNIPQFSVNYFNLSFTEAKSSYVPGKEVEAPKYGWLVQGTDNAVLQDYRSGTVTASKQVYEQRFIIQDTQRHLRWRMSDELRTIAGHQCHKAVTRICDSVYIVAFYTEDIPVSGGPEQFGGLPGMILELAVPRLRTTWIATKVEAIAVNDEDLKAPAAKRAKKVNQQQLMTNLQSSLKDWGKWGSRSTWWNSL